MNIHEIFDKIENPKKYYQSGKELYFDSYRNVMLPVTPEETVRQKTTVYLEEYLCVPHNCISTEVHLHHYEGVTDNGRIDITVNVVDENRINRTIAVVECKASHIPITKQTTDQAAYYANAICCDYLIITNGIELLILVFYLQEKQSTIQSMEIQTEKALWLSLSATVKRTKWWFRSI